MILPAILLPLPTIAAIAWRRHKRSRNRALTFLTAPVDAGRTVAEATAAQAKLEDREERKTEKNAKKGLGPDGKQKAKNGGGRKPMKAGAGHRAPAADRVAADGTPLILLGYESAEREPTSRLKSCA